MEQRCDDGVLEIMGLRDGWHSAFVLLSVCTAVRLCQVSPCEFPTRLFEVPVLVIFRNIEWSHSEKMIFGFNISGVKVEYIGTVVPETHNTVDGILR